MSGRGLRPVTGQGISCGGRDRRSVEDGESEINGYYIRWLAQQPQSRLESLHCCLLTLLFHVTPGANLGERLQHTAAISKHSRLQAHPFGLSYLLWPEADAARQSVARYPSSLPRSHVKARLGHYERAFQRGAPGCYMSVSASD